MQRAPIYIYIPFEPGDVVSILGVKMERPPPNFSNQNSPGPHLGETGEWMKNGFF